MSEHEAGAAMRQEHDSLGAIDVPATALYGAQTQRAVLNFSIGREAMPEALVRALLLVKAAAAAANAQLGALDPQAGAAIAAACHELLSDDGFMRHFPLDVFQTGSGTSTNMNANEVLATMATARLGRRVDANDEVNCSQSSNDVLPSAIHVSAALALQRELLPALEHLGRITRDKARSLCTEVKTGRTHLMDAMPVRMDQVLGGWGAQLQHAARHLAGLQPALQRLAQGGTAVGTGVNAPEGFARRFHVELSALTGLEFAAADDYFAAMGSQDSAVALSGGLKTLAVALLKIANDLRWMNSGPFAGLGEIALVALQPGSSIMPGKVNPVIPEAVAMAAVQVIGNDTAITLAGASGNFELNTMLPLVARNLLQSLALMTRASRSLADQAIAGFTVDSARLRLSLAKNPVLATALNPLIGYARAAEIAQRALHEDRPIIDVADEMTDLGRARLEDLLDPLRLTGGVR